MAPTTVRCGHSLGFGSGAVLVPNLPLLRDFSLSPPCWSCLTSLIPLTPHFPPGNLTQTSVPTRRGLPRSDHHPGPAPNLTHTLHLLEISKAPENGKPKARLTVFCPVPALLTVVLILVSGTRARNRGAILGKSFLFLPFPFCHQVLHISAPTLPSNPLLHFIPTATPTAATTTFPEPCHAPLVATPLQHLPGHLLRCSLSCRGIIFLKCKSNHAVFGLNSPVTSFGFSEKDKTRYSSYAALWGQPPESLSDSAPCHLLPPSPRCDHPCLPSSALSATGTPRVPCSSV